MSQSEINEVLKELNTVRPEMLTDKAKRVFNAIMSIADERDNYYTELKKLKEELEYNHNINCKENLEDKVDISYIIQRILDIIKY